MWVLCGPYPQVLSWNTLCTFTVYHSAVLFCLIFGIAYNAYKYQYGIFIVTPCGGPLGPTGARSGVTPEQGCTVQASILLYFMYVHLLCTSYFYLG